MMISVMQQHSLKLLECHRFIHYLSLIMLFTESFSRLIMQVVFEIRLVLILLSACVAAFSDDYFYYFSSRLMLLVANIANGSQYWLLKETSCSAAATAYHITIVFFCCCWLITVCWEMILNPLQKFGFLKLYLTVIIVNEFIIVFIVIEVMMLAHQHVVMQWILLSLLLQRRHCQLDFVDSSRGAQRCLLWLKLLQRRLWRFRRTSVVQ